MLEWLVEGGWFPGRRVDLAAYRAHLGAGGYALSPAVTEFLAEFVGAAPRASLAAMAALLLLAFLLPLLVEDQHAGGAVQPEHTYVSAARMLLHLPQPPDARYANALLGRDPNTEHPPLGTLLIAGSMLLAGDDAYGWRWPAVLAGMLAIAFLYRIARLVGLGARPALLAAFLLAFDTLAFLQDRLAMLDGPMLLGIVAGLCWFLEGRPLLAGLAFAGDAR